MERYESILKAMREVKRLLVEDKAKELYLVSDAYQESFFITEDSFHAKEIISTHYFDNCSDDDPEWYARNIVVVEYMERDMEWQSRYPMLAKKFKRSILAKNVNRRKKSAEAEYSVSFNI